jgi:hypothetical protein
MMFKYVAAFAVICLLLLCLQRGCERIRNARWDRWDQKKEDRREHREERFNRDDSENNEEQERRRWRLREEL